MAWCVEVFTNGTQIVVDRLAGRSASFYRVVGPGGELGDNLDDRLKMALDLMSHLRGGPAPAWLRDMERIESRLVGLDKSVVQAVGPYIEIYEEPFSRFQQCMSDASIAARYELIDRLVS